MTVSAAFASTINWEKTSWQGEPAWISSHDGVRAIVSEARARLIYLGSDDGSLNLLNAPCPQVHPDKKNPWPNQGGHRFWLGPQSRWGWPPPAEWEYAAAQRVTAEGAVLTVLHARRDPAYPVIAREYAWQGRRLRCTAYWQDDGHAYFGLHIVAVDTPFTITNRLNHSKEAPAGFVAARMIDPEAAVQLPHPAVTIKGNLATMIPGKKAKLGFTPQPLTIDRPHGWKLSMQPGPCSVAFGASPDQGYLSQVWVGDTSSDLAEIEQLTPPLKGDASGRCTSTIYLEAAPPSF
jgi:hypothetical protein